jgi:hypothetical protein
MGPGPRNLLLPAMMQKRSGPRANRKLQENVMRKIAIASIAAALVGASALTSLEANAGPNYQPASPSLQLLNKGPIYSPSNPALQPIGNPHGPIVDPAKNPCVNGGWCDPHNHGGGWGHGGFGVRVGFVSAAASDEDCYYVRRRVFVQNYGIVIKRTLVCES